LTHVSAISSEVPLHLPCIKHPASNGKAHLSFQSVRNIPLPPARSRGGALRLRRPLANEEGRIAAVEWIPESDRGCSHVNGLRTVPTLVIRLASGLAFPTSYSVRALQDIFSISPSPSNEAISHTAFIAHSPFRSASFPSQSLSLSQTNCTPSNGEGYCWYDRRPGHLLSQQMLIRASWRRAVGIECCAYCPPGWRKRPCPRQEPFLWCVLDVFVGHTH